MVEIKRFVVNKSAGWKGLVCTVSSQPGKEFIMNEASVWEATPKRVAALEEITPEQADIPALLSAWQRACERMRFSMSIVQEVVPALSGYITEKGDL